MIIHDAPCFIMINHDYSKNPIPPINPIPSPSIQSPQLVMKFSVSSAEFRRLLSMVSAVVDKKNVCMIMDYVLVTKDSEGAFFISGAASERYVTMMAPLAQVEAVKFTPFCLHLAKFVNMLSLLGDQPIEINVNEADNFLTTVRYAGGEFIIPSKPGAEFPVQAPMAENDDDVEFSLPSAELLERVNGAFACTAEDDTMPVRSAVALDVSAEGVAFVGTDSFKLYVSRYHHGVPFLSRGAAKKILLHRALVKSLQAVIGRSDTVRVRANAKRVEFSIDGAVLSASTLAIAYVNYERVIPKSSSFVAKMSVKDLSLAVRRAMVMGNDATGLVVLSCSEGALTVNADNAEFGGCASAVIPCSECSLPDGFFIGFRSSDLLLLLNNLPGPDVALRFSTPQSVILVVDAAPDSSLVQLMMPVSVA